MYSPMSPQYDTRLKAAVPQKRLPGSSVLQAGAKERFARLAEAYEALKDWLFGYYTKLYTIFY